MVAAADEDGIVGVRISEIGGRIPVGAEEDRSVAWVVLGSSASVSEGVWEVGAAGGDGEDEVVGRTICEDGGSVPVAAGLSASGVFSA